MADKVGKATVVKPGDKISAAGIAMEAVPAYNANKRFHRKSAGRVAYIITLNGKRIYHSGDADLVPEMAQIKCAIALVPVSGTYVITAAEAAEAAKTLKPSLTIPIHEGDPDVVGTRANLEEFKRLANVPVEILEKSKRNCRGVQHLPSPALHQTQSGASVRAV